MGGNPAENHPVGFRFVMDAKRNRNAKLVCVDPRFNRTAAVADRFVQIRAGSDIAFLGGLIHHVLTQNRYHDAVRAAVHERLVPRVRGISVRRSGRPVLGLGSRAEELHQQIELELRAGRARLCPRRSDAAASAIGLPGDEDGSTPATRRKWCRRSAAAVPPTSSRRPSSSPPPTRRIARARSCTPSAGRTTATRCSSFTRRPCCSCCSGTSAGPAAA